VREVSRSSRHHPIAGMTMAASEKDDKQRDAQAKRTLAHVCERKAVFTEIEFPPEKRHDGNWIFAKDGKVRFDWSERKALQK